MNIPKSASTGLLVVGILASLGCATSTRQDIKQSGMDKYQRKEYVGAIEDFSTYLLESPGDKDIRLLRGIAKSLLKPEDVAGACADFQSVRENLRRMNVEKYCAGQPGW
jgi:hypothetical protein